MSSIEIISPVFDHVPCAEIIDSIVVCDTGLFDEGCSHDNLCCRVNGIVSIVVLVVVVVGCTSNE
jgi:hypothetical protein